MRRVDLNFLPRAMMSPRLGVVISCCCVMTKNHCLQPPRLCKFISGDGPARTWHAGLPQSNTSFSMRPIIATCASQSESRYTSSMRCSLHQRKALVTAGSVLIGVLMSSAIDAGHAVQRTRRESHRRPPPLRVRITPEMIQEAQQRLIDLGYWIEGT